MLCGTCGREHAETLSPCQFTAPGFSGNASHTRLTSFPIEGHHPIMTSVQPASASETIIPERRISGSAKLCPSCNGVGVLPASFDPSEASRAVVIKWLKDVLKALESTS